MMQLFGNKKAGKAKKTGRSVKKWLPLILALALLTTAGVGTLAYLQVESGFVTNNFTKATVNCEITEDFEQGGSVKKDVAVSNTGTAYLKVRAAVTVNWVDAAGNISAQTPVAGTDYEISYGEDWTKVSDGIFEYNSVLKPDETSSNLIHSCKPIVTKDGFTLMVDVSVTAVQADKASTAWST